LSGVSHRYFHGERFCVNRYSAFKGEMLETVDLQRNPEGSLGIIAVIGNRLPPWVMKTSNFSSAKETDATTAGTFGRTTLQLLILKPFTVRRVPSIAALSRTQLMFTFAFLISVRSVMPGSVVDFIIDDAMFS